GPSARLPAVYRGHLLVRAWRGSQGIPGGGGGLRPQTSFDPKADAIVRVEATRLRARLKQYYQTEGTRDALVIEMPKGSYAPSFQPRDAAPEGRSIVVLPFDNMSAEPENEYFSDGLTEEIINALTRIDGLRVVARTSAFQYKGKAIDVRR